MFMISFFLLCSSIFHLKASKNPDQELILIGPSISKHFNTPYEFNQWHPGIGGEFRFMFKKWKLGIYGYYMSKDSNNRHAYWGGVTTGYFIGSNHSLWCEPFIIIGGIKKHEFHSGQFGFFALPVLSLGYQRFGINIGFIPTIPEVTNPVLIVQFKFKILYKFKR